MLYQSRVVSVPFSGVSPFERSVGRPGVRWALFGLLLCLSFVLLQSPARAQSPAVFVGPLIGNEEAFLGIVVDQMEVTAYVCDGTPDGWSVWGWFNGSVAETGTGLVSTNGHLLVIATIGDNIVGTLTSRDGESFPFELDLATGEAGFYRFQGVVAGTPVLAGKIVLADGRERGAALLRGSATTTELAEELREAGWVYPDDWR